MEKVTIFQNIKKYSSTRVINIEAHAITIKILYPKIKLKFHIAYLDFVFVAIGVISLEFKRQEFDRIK